MYKVRDDNDDTTTTNNDNKTELLKIREPGTETLNRVTRL